ncbi:MAG: 5-(carboxyamino)imidazole ribonucleotide synthase [Pedobacter sp.]|jgi:5-(carboxyamino)imidazole ribonucleotide synthase
MKAFYGDLKLGILGGGQLGRMLIQESINYNITTYVLDPDAEAPCKDLCKKFIQGSLTDFEAVYNFGKQVDILTIEIEKVNVNALEQLEKEGITVYPQSRVIRLIQDKGVQKQFFKENDIPTAPFQLFQNKQELIGANIPFPYIQKLRRDGYDGRGVNTIKSAKDLEKAFSEPSLVEELINFDQELSVIVSRNEDGEIKTFPCVEMEFNQEANLVEFLISPSDLNPEILQKADQLAVKVAKDLKIVGILAVELFLTKEGNIMVNEIAPRPHNSGHQSIEGNYTSQYEQLLRAIFNLPPGDTRTISNSVMINLLGEKGYEGAAQYEGLNEVLELDGVYIHLYGKKFTKPFRKMGHVTIMDDDRQKAIEKARFVQKKIKVKI